MAAPQPSALPVPVTPRRLTARALLLGERIDKVGLERSEMISTDRTSQKCLCASSGVTQTKSGSWLRNHVACRLV